MDTISIVIETEQSCSMTYHLNITELEELISLIINGGKAVISGCQLHVRDDYLIQYKGKDFQGANYAMPLEGVLSMLKSEFLKYHNDQI